ncbi:hypothetical protein ONZ45_g11244 [Pleurotus djamor]|nr:hypothetical protein ONZ45_g11244 [Pleurotus djamor]
MHLIVILTLIVAHAWIVKSQRKILLTSDNGWAVAQVRAEYDALVSAGYDVILDAPADDASSGSISPIITIPILNIRTRVNPCQFNTCSRLLDPLGIPLSGFPVNGSDPSNGRLKYITGFTTDALRDGITRLAPTFFGSNPDLVIVGSHIGNKFGSDMQTSDGIEAAAEAIKLGIPAIAFSGASGAQVSFTTLQSNPTSQASVAASVYSALIVKLVNALNSGSDASPILPPGIGLAINFPSITDCPTASSINYVLSRITPDPNPNDVSCVNIHLPAETNVVSAGCLASISAFDAMTLADVEPLTHVALMSRLLDILICPRLVS